MLGQQRSTPLLSDERLQAIRIRVANGIVLERDVEDLLHHIDCLGASPSGGDEVVASDAPQRLTNERLRAIRVSVANRLVLRVQLKDLLSHVEYFKQADAAIS